MQRLCQILALRPGRAQRVQPMRDIAHTCNSKLIYTTASLAHCRPHHFSPLATLTARSSRHHDLLLLLVPPSTTLPPCGGPAPMLWGGAAGAASTNCRRFIISGSGAPPPPRSTTISICSPTPLHC